MARASGTIGCRSKSDRVTTVRVAGESTARLLGPSGAQLTQSPEDDHVTWAGVQVDEGIQNHRPPTLPQLP